ncbi:MAG: hypothetical protein J6B77_03845, partial [Clostridia bacterium]|nr:hypothetical protein [Clostridia bacterium]
IYADKDYDGHYYEHAAICTADMAECYAVCGDDARALLCLSKAVECAMEVNVAPLSDSLFAEREDSGEVRPLTVQMRDDFFVKPAFDAIRNDPTFPTLSE